MVERLQSPDLVDPLIGNSTFSLFFRTFGDLMKAADSQPPDLESVHNYLKSTALKSPSKLLEQAKTILSSSSELPNSELLFQMASEDKAGAAAAKGNDHPPERRPALNRKRARFSLKPITSQPSLYVNTSLNIDQLEDPEDYFLAHEKLENAEKELRKQRGDALMGLDQYNLTETARHRRPGLLGKRASYKHHPLLLHSENDETIESSQETSEVGISSAPKYTSDPETIYQHGAPQQRKIADDEHVDATQEEDSVALKEDRFGRLWDELLSANCMDLDGDRAATFLQERLQFKPISLDKLSLPDLDSVLRNNLEAPVEQLAKPRKALADIHNTIRRADRKASEEHRQLLGVSVCPQASRLEQKSPSASLSFLKRRISHMNSPSDPFLALDGDMSPANVEGIGKRALPPHVVADHLDADNHTPPEVGGKGLSSSGELQSQLVGEEGNIVLRNDLEAPVEQLAKPRKALADIQNTIRRADRKASEECMQLLGVSVCPQASHLEQKSPPASLSFLKRRISHMNSPSDPFLAVGGDMSPASVEGIGKQALPPHVVADHLDADNHTPSEVGGKGLSSSGELQSQLVGEEGNIVLRNDLEAPVEQLVKPRKALADIQNTIRRADCKASEEHMQLLGVSVCPQASHLEQKSPPASLSFLKRRISHMNSPSDPFLAVGGDMSPASVEGIGKQALPPHVVADHLDADNHTPSEVGGKGLSFSGELQSQLVGEEGNTAANILDSGKLVAEDLASSLDRLVDEDANGHDTSMDVSLNGSKGDSEDKIEDVLKEAVASEQPELVIEGLTMDTLHCSDSQLDQSGPTAGEYGSVDGHAETRDIPLEQNEEVNELNSRTPPNMHTKPKLHAHQRDKRTKFSHRQSLAGAGSLWESGVRRSNRIKIKPLEWWNGERLLYGRIHHSLETVIGLKYASPAKGGGKPTFRVKSFVSDEYKHLVEQAGLH